VQGPGRAEADIGHRTVTVGSQDGRSARVTARPVAFVGDPLALIGGPLALVSEAVAFISGLLAFVGGMVALVGDAVALERRDLGLVKGLAALGQAGLGGL